MGYVPHRWSEGFVPLGQVPYPLLGRPLSRGHGFAGGFSRRRPEFRADGVDDLHVTSLCSVVARIWGVLTHVVMM